MASRSTITADECVPWALFDSRARRNHCVTCFLVEWEIAVYAYLAIALSVLLALGINASYVEENPFS
jgi:hypothetical protein